MFILLVHSQGDYHPRMDKGNFSKNSPISVAQEPILVDRLPFGNVDSKFLSSRVTETDVQTFACCVAHPRAVQVAQHA